MAKRSKLSEFEKKRVYSSEKIWEISERNFEGLWCS